MNRVEGYITAHMGEDINECDDNFSVSLKNCCFAIADGSSSDYFSSIYSMLLVDNFVKDPTKIFLEETIHRVNDDWRQLVVKSLDKAGCKLGSFPFIRYQRRDPGYSTFIGLRFFEEDNGIIKFHCSGLGDSVLFFVPKSSKIPKLQFSSYSNENYSLNQDVKFGYTPILANSYSTKWLENISNYEGILEKGIFYLMTDGLAEWILRKDNGEISDKFTLLNRISSQEEFLSYISDIRKNGAHNDDMTLLKIYIEDISLIFNEKDSNIFDYKKEQKKLEDSAENTPTVIPDSPSLQQESNTTEINGIISKVSSSGKQQNPKEESVPTTEQETLDETVENTSKVNQEESTDTTNKQDDKEKKKFRLIMIMISFIAIIGYIGFATNLNKKEKLEKMVVKLQEQHKSDSIKIMSLNKKIFKQDDLIKEHTAEREKNKRRMEYLKAYPTAYKNTIKIE